ncbi:MAG: glycosyltransferase family 4 protein [Candidatus Nealsonbacteria bacterium]|nr:glycosyltransferase family 4 protein [Candidatus Nealsonbacteria bacterium]
MRLIYISNARIPTEKAHGIHIMKMCEVLANPTEKVEVELVIPRRFNKIKENPFKYYGINSNFKIKKLPCLDLIPLDKYIGYLGLWTESVTFSFFLFWYLLFKRPDIIYIRDKFFLPFAFFRKNIIFEAHTFPKNFIFYLPFLKSLKGLVVITQKLKELFAERGISTDKILAAPDGVDIEMFDIHISMQEARKKLGLPQDKKIVLYTGHLYQWKGVDVLAEASRYLPENIEVYFVGGTEEDIKSYQILATRYRIHVIGHRSHSEIPFWLKAADVLILPNSGKEDISKYWTSPLKMFEYMAAEKPIVASDLPSIREVLNEENAVLVEPDNPTALAKGVEDILKNSKLSEKISKKAYVDVAENYTWLRRRKKIFEFFNL